jgi:hypothetical protein
MQWHLQLGATVTSPNADWLVLAFHTNNVSPCDTGHDNEGIAYRHVDFGRVMRARLAVMTCGQVLARPLAK